MFRSRTLPALVMVLGLLAALGPSLAWASGGSGGSAGDNQYVDPLAGVHTHTGGSHPASSGSAPSAPASTPTSSSYVAPASTATTPTATAAATTTDPSGKARTLPFTGFEDWQAAGLGAMLLAGGLLLRRRALS
ncbi:MAG TPA: hypothetical protein VF781_08385 [Solirubrobacteraceae bacterium]